MRSTRPMRRGGIGIVLVAALIAVGTSPTLAQEATPDSTQPVTVADTEITWSGEWDHTTRTSTSIPDQAAFSHVDVEDQILKTLTYGVLRDEDVASTPEALDRFADANFDDAGAADVVESATGAQEDGTLWRVYTFITSEGDDIRNENVASLVTASQRADGAYVLTSLTTNIAILEETIPQVQDQFVVDGDGQLFAGINAAEVTADLGPGASPERVTAATPEASPEITDIGSPETTPGATPIDFPEASPDATPIGDAEATLAAIQDLEEEETPPASPGSTPAD